MHESDPDQIEPPSPLFTDCADADTLQRAGCASARAAIPHRQNVLARAGHGAGAVPDDVSLRRRSPHARRTRRHGVHAMPRASDTELMTSRMTKGRLDMADNINALQPASSLPDPGGGHDLRMVRATGARRGSSPAIDTAAQVAASLAGKAGNSVTSPMAALSGISRSSTRSRRHGRVLWRMRRAYGVTRSGGRSTRYPRQGRVPGARQVTILRIHDRKWPRTNLTKNPT